MVGQKFKFGRLLVFSAIFLGFLLFFLASYSLFLKDPPVWPDEAIFTDIAKNLNKNNKLKTNIFGPLVLGLEKNAFWYPPLYFYLLSFWLKIFGESIEGVRLLSFIFSLFSLVVFFLIIKSLFKSNLFSFLGVLFLIFDFWFWRASKVARMDIINFFFLLLTIYFLVIKDKKPLFYFLAGISSSLAILSHPFGFLPLLISLFYIFFEFKNEGFSLKKIFLFFLPVFFSLLFWFLLIKGNLGLFSANIVFSLKEKQR